MVTGDITFYGIFRKLMSEPRVSIPLPAEFDLSELVEALGQRLGEGIRSQLMTRAGHIQPYVTVFIDGRQVRGVSEERFGPFRNSGTKIDIYIVPGAEGGGINEKEVFL